MGDSWANSVEAIVSFLERTCGDTHTENGGGGGEHCQRLNGYNVDFIVGLMKRHYATELRENGYKARDAVHPRRQAVCGDQICNRQGSSTLASRF